METRNLALGKVFFAFVISMGYILQFQLSLDMIQYTWFLVPVIYCCFARNKELAIKIMASSLFCYFIHIRLTEKWNEYSWMLPFSYYILIILYIQKRANFVNSIKSNYQCRLKYGSFFVSGSTDLIVCTIAGVITFICSPNNDQEESTYFCFYWTIAFYIAWIFIDQFAQLYGAQHKLINDYLVKTEEKYEEPLDL